MTNSNFDKVRESVLNFGFLGTAVKIGRMIVSRIGYRSVLTREKIRIGARLSAELNDTVAYGPFKGLILNSKSSWNRADRGSMLLGIYEREVSDVLPHVLLNRSVFVDFGAADGFYALGVLVSGLAERSIAFEQCQKSRKILLDSARLNSVDNQLTILGKANENDIINLALNLPINETVFLFDVEGAEYLLLTECVFSALKGATIIVEVHKFGHISPYEVLATLIKRCGIYYQLEIITQGSRNPLDIKEMSNIDDDQCWLICSEGRSYRQIWAKFTSIKIN